MVKNSLFFKKSEFSEIKSYAKRLNSESESGEIGYYDLPNFGDEIIKETEEFFKDKIYDNIVLVGIGGSSVGVRAILRALRAKKMRARLRILDNIDGFRFDTITQSIEFDKTIFIISSKSGTTVETISIFKAILDFYKPSDISKNFIFITDNGSKLEKFANQNNAKVFNIPKNVGGRFSILSAIGLVPMVALGLDAKALLQGGAQCKADFFDEKDDTLLQKAYHYATHKYAKINVLFSYCDRLAGLNDWYVQLWAESLGKKLGHTRFGLTPIGLVGSKDQHSFLQLIIDGTRDKTVSFIKILNQNSEKKVPNLSLENLDDLDFANGICMSEIINLQCDATMHALINEGISVDLIEVSELNERNLGYLFYYFELLTSAVGIMFGVNTYDQPGVEIGKRILKSLILKEQI